jgi:hypothetical protein
MKENDVDTMHDLDSQPQSEQKPTATIVEDDSNLEENDLKRTYLFGKSEDKNPDQPGFEGEGMGGQSFGKNNVTPSGDDQANPSQNAGYANAYFKRTEPSEEHPEDTNFKDGEQAGEPDYKQAQGHTAENGDQTGNESNHEDQHEQQPDQNTYQEGTADNDGEANETVNVPGPGELPEQQQVGESGNTSKPGKADYKPEDDEGKPDYGSHSPEDQITP